MYVSHLCSCTMRHNYQYVALLGRSLGGRESGKTFPQVHWVGVWGDVPPGALGGRESGETFPQVHWVGVWGDVSPGALGGSLGRRSPRCTRWESGETFPQVH